MKSYLQLLDQDELELLEKARNSGTKLGELVNLVYYIDSLAGEDPEDFRRRFEATEREINEKLLKALNDEKEMYEDALAVVSDYKNENF